MKYKLLGKSGLRVAEICLGTMTFGEEVPIVGARKDSQISDSLGCVDFQLSKEHMDRLDEVSKIESGFPHDFLQNEPAKTYAFSGKYDSIINHRKT